MTCDVLAAPKGEAEIAFMKRSRNCVCIIRYDASFFFDHIFIGLHHSLRSLQIDNGDVGHTASSRISSARMQH